LASGLLTGKYNDGISEDSRLNIPGFEWLKEKVLIESRIEKVRKLKSVADKLETSLATLSIAWCIKNPYVSTAILGATSKKQLQENLGSIELYPKINNDILKEIDDIMATKPILPEY
jgi:aryl-alcohol dehydrogenase-like predicted oxidoreductase